ncbi:TM0106 family RecB-like putative nuclease [Candidatus Aquiluna sp. UB-MaderosW2red]|uniref:TM0106 family RecB-like putative nuclease n=1 Tax=Candidatus Aquiluna sp. UB-MaderosW2red TaxID=1855377 RepID=UPI0015613434|nr:TM0106 family RecB-like putative nuclease [Candidatus Aquiluna sp. UB-MaderosW2red]
MHKNGDLWFFNTRDLMRAATCEHCTTLSVFHALQVPEVELRLAPEIKKQKERRAKGEDKSLPQKYGDAFELKLTEELTTSLPQGAVARPEKDGDVAQTLELMHQGVPIIYQGGLEHRAPHSVFKGKPDFLVKQGWLLEFVDGLLTARLQQEIPGPPKYIVWDAKYSSHPKPEYALQVAIYVEALDAQGLKAPNSRHGLILGNRTMMSFQEGEIVPATRIARQELEQAIARVSGSAKDSQLESFTWHCASNRDCEICEYPELCKDDREATKDLLLVAGLGKNLRAKLNAAGIQNLSELARSPLEKVPDVTKATFSKMQKQAALQLLSMETNQPEHELLEDPLLQFLPRPSAGDVFFDMEGFPYFPDGGLEYLFGNWTRDSGFTDFWAVDRAEEKQAFIQFMTWLMDRMDKHPDAHIFHYASYEKTALLKLANRHGVMGPEVRRLEQDKRLVDLYPIVTKSLRIGEPKYSIKNLERHYGFKRESEVTNASASIDEYAQWRDLVAGSIDLTLGDQEQEDLGLRAQNLYHALHDYNKEDVISTMELYDWLLTMPGAASRFGEDGKFQEDDSEENPSASALELQELEAKTARFFLPLKNWPWGESIELDIKAKVWETLAHSILFYRREDVMFWADLQIRMNQDEEAFEKDREALLISDVTQINRSEKLNKKGNLVHVVSYQANYPKESIYNPSPGDEIIIRFPIGAGLQNRNFGKVTEVAQGLITFSRDTQDPDDLFYQPDALIKFQRFLAKSKQDELNNLAERITEVWGSPSNPAPTKNSAMDLLLRRRPRLIGDGQLAQADPSNYLPALIESVGKMDNTVLAVQGPPGSGKTYLASHLIAHLLAAGKSVAVGSNSHAVVENVLKAAMEAGVNPAQIFKAKKTKDTAEYPWVTASSAGTIGKKIARANHAVLVGGTAFALSNKEVRSNHFDYLIIDEAAQFSLVDALAVSGIADNMILFGDPQQLPQVVQATHPGGLENSALGHYMGDYEILPKGMGYFVEVTRRLHPNINAPVSWLSYENKLRSHPDTNKHIIQGIAPGLYKAPINHTGNSTFSPQEVTKVIELVEKHINEVGAEEILIVAPFNAQVNAIRKALDKANHQEVAVGTVDKFQGQEGLVVIYSFTSSSSQDAPRGLGFLLDRNRMNVAISRAKSVCYLVYSTNLPKAVFSSLEDVKGISRLAGLLGMAKELD